MSILLENEEATLAFAQTLAKYCLPGTAIYLYGDLGSGKTTLVRGLVQYFLPDARVKSPTYNLVEGYDLKSAKSNPQHLQQLYHFDLYRLAHPEELEYLGGRDYFDSDAVCLVEWPIRGEGWLKPADLEIRLEYKTNGRLLEYSGLSETGRRLEQNITTHL